MKILCCFLICLPLLLRAQTDIACKGVRFEQGLTWEQIIAKAQAENKYIFVDCYATWCGPCKMMDRDVFPHFRVGDAINQHFISVKVQMDSTIKDNAEVKSWYTDARKMMQNYQITALPTYLFFSSNGKLVHKETGFIDAINFIRISKLARSQKKLLYYTQYEAYKKGEKDYVTMEELAIFTKKMIGDEAVADMMAKDYKENYLNNIDTSVLYTEKNINFISEFPHLINSNDNFFLFAYNRPQQFDSIKGKIWEGYANWLVNETITREEIASKVLENGIATQKTPNWELIRARIAQKYKNIDARKMVLNYKITYYKDLYKDWILWAKYKDEMIKAYPPKPPYGLTVYTDINGYGGAWHAFLHCSNRTVLLKALEWVNLALKLDSEDEAKRAAYWDTKANLLYKLGRKKEALSLQKEAVELSRNGFDNSEIVGAYNKMLQGKPTWPTTENF